MSRNSWILAAVLLGCGTAPSEGSTNGSTGSEASGPTSTGSDSSASSETLTTGSTTGTISTGTSTSQSDSTSSSSTGNDAEPPWVCPGETIEVVGVAEQTNILPAIETAASRASNGDCIVLPAGEFHAEGEISISVSVSLLGQGSGRGGTWVRRAEDYPEDTLAGETMITYDVNSREPSGVVIAGIRFSSKAPQEGKMSGSLATDFGLALRGLVDFVITDCRFENFGYAGISIEHFDDISRGLIYDSVFVHNAKGDGQGLGYGIAFFGENEEWLEDPQFGSDNFIFVEDSEFTRHRHALAAGGAARYVIRHSEIVDSLYSAAGVDAHEGRNVGIGGSNHFSTRAVEVYENTLRNDHFNDGTPIEPGGDLNNLGLMAIGIRGGEAVIHNNEISGFLNGISLIVFNTQDEEWGVSSYPYPYQIGWQSGDALGAKHTGTGVEEGRGDVFEWDNDFTPYAPTGQERKYWLDSSSQMPGALEEGRDYHLDTARPGYTPYTYPHPERINWQGPSAEAR